MTRMSLTGFGGVQLAADTFGSPGDPTVLLIPGINQTREVWHAAAKALAEAGRYAVAIDMRGHGDSDHAPQNQYGLDAYVSDLKAILNNMPTRACIVASGVGSMAAIAAVGESEPDLVSGLVLVDSTIWFDRVASAPSALVRREASFDSVEAILESFAAIHPTEPKPSPNSRLLAAYKRGDDGRYHWRGDKNAKAAWDLAKEQQRLEACVARIGVPVALIHGELDDTVSHEDVDRLQRIIPGAEMFEIEGIGHYSQIEKEDDFNAVLLDFLERRAPREALSYVGGSEPRTLRNALGCFATGVTVVTTVGADGEPIGLTANSFTSVSLDPPLILFSLVNQSASMETFRTAGRFAVNVLHIGQQPVSNRFASRDQSRFEGVDWAYRIDGGSPILAGSLASFDCTTYAVHDGGDHTIFIGEVHHAWFEPHRDPLLYFRGKYRRLHFS